MIIRPATAADLPRCVEMARKFHAFAGLDHVAPFCEKSTLATGYALSEHGIFLVAEIGGFLIGMIGVMVSPVAHNHAFKQAVEVMWWVEQEAWSQGIGSALIANAESAAKDRGAKSVMMIHLQNSPDAARAMYESRGYRELETVFVKAL